MIIAPTQKRISVIPQLWFHTAGWVLFIGYEVGLLFVQHYMSVNSFIASLPYYGLYISFFYVDYFILNYSFSRSKRSYLYAILLFVAALLVELVLKYGLDYLALPYQRFVKLLSKTNALEYVVVNAWRCTYFGVISLLYWSAIRMIRYRETIIQADKETIALLEEKSVLEKNLSDTRFAYYQQQINPHFLFNTLNFIYNSVYKHSREASNAVILLSEIMRFSLDEMDTDGKTIIDREVEQIQNLIEINKLRFDFKLNIKFDVDGDFETVRFIPLILLTFAENVFKYGQLKDEKNPARLSLTLTDDNRLIFETWNAKKHINQLKGSTGIGVANAIKRLEYTYGDRFNLHIDDQEKAYALKLTVDL